MRRSASAAVLVTALMLLTGCGATTGGTAKDSGPIRIVSGQAAQNGTVLRTIFDRYRQQHPGAAVQLELDNRTDADTAQKALADAQAGSPPDAVRVTNLTARAFVDAGLAQPVDRCLDSDPALKAQLSPAALTASTVGGKSFEIPWYTTAPALFYNSDAFTAAGLDPQRPPATWSQLRAAAAKLSDLRQDRFGAVVAFGNSYNFEGALRSGGGSMVDAGEKTPTFSSAAGVAVFAFWRDLVANGWMPVYGNDFFTQAADDFSSGRVAMYLGSASSYGGLLRKAHFPVRMAAMLAPDGHPALAPLSTNGFILLTKDPQRQRATCEALLSLLRPDAVTDTVKTTATLPLNSAAARDERYLAPYLRDHPDLQRVNAQRTFSWYALPGRGNAEFQAAYLDEQNLVLRGAVTPQRALDDLAATARKLLAQS